MSITTKTREEILRSHGLEPDPVIEHYKKDVDRTLLRENLRLSPEERIRKGQEMLEFAEEVRRSGREMRRRRGAGG